MLSKSDLIQLNAARASKNILTELKNAEPGLRKAILKKVTQTVERNAISDGIKASQLMIKEFSKNELKSKTIKTNITPSQLIEFETKRGNAGYTSNSDFIRDLVLDAVSFKPPVNNKTKAYFNQSRELKDSILELCETVEIEGLNNRNVDLISNALKLLAKNQDNISSSLLNAHNSKTAYIIARQYLSLDDLKKLSEEMA